MSKTKMKSEYLMQVDDHQITITHPDRILFPRTKITKLDLINYYNRIAPLMIPHVKNRPVSMQRFPDGINDEGFYQKNAPDYFPDWIQLARVEKEDKSKIVSHVLCNNRATLIYLANQAVITPHVWLSEVDKLNYPDLMIFDLDPPSTKTFKAVCEAAQLIRISLQKIGLHPFVMTTGSKGLHVTTPIKRELVFDEVRIFARSFAQQLVNEHPDLLTLEVRKNKRKGKVFIDYLRNAWTQTGVAPYAVRAKEGAPIATPLYWKELSNIPNAQRYTIKNIFRRVSRTGDPWAAISKYAGSIKYAQTKI